MTRYILLSLLFACTSETYGFASDPLAGDASVACVPDPLPDGYHLLGADVGEGFPHEIMSWDRYQSGGVFRLGGQGGAGYLGTEVLQLDADLKISFQLDGGQVIKLHDHPVVGALWWFGEVEHVWFGNTLEGDGDFRYQGTNSAFVTDPGGTARAYRLLITGQGMNGLAEASTAVFGGDVVVTGGDANSGFGASRHPGDVVLRGGAHGFDTAGNVALHANPGDDWGGGERVLFVGDALTVPTADPTGGGFFFASGGALYWRGSAGTVTQLAAP